MSDSPAPPYNSLLMAALFTAAYVALVIAAFGFISLALDRDVLPTGLPPVIGPIMVAAGAVVVFFAQRGIVHRRSPLAPALLAGAGSYLAMLAVLTVAAAPVTGALAVGPFLPTAGVLAAGIAVTSWATARVGTRPRGGGPGDGGEA